MDVHAAVDLSRGETGRSRLPDSVAKSSSIRTPNATSRVTNRVTTAERRRAAASGSEFRPVAGELRLEDATATVLTGRGDDVDGPTARFDRLLAERHRSVAGRTALQPEAECAQQLRALVEIEGAPGGVRLGEDIHRREVGDVSGPGLPLTDADVVDERDVGVAVAADGDALRVDVEAVEQGLDARRVVGLPPRLDAFVPPALEPRAETEVEAVLTLGDDVGVEEDALDVERLPLRGRGNLVFVEQSKHRLGEIPLGQRGRPRDEITPEVDDGDARDEDGDARDGGRDADEDADERGDGEIDDRTGDTPILARVLRLAESTNPFADRSHESFRTPVRGRIVNCTLATASRRRGRPAVAPEQVPFLKEYEVDGLFRLVVYGRLRSMNTELRANGTDTGIGPTADVSARYLAEQICEGFISHDRRERSAAIESFTNVDAVQFAHLDGTRARQAATAYVNALWAKDAVEQSCMQDGTLDREALADADWSSVRAAFARRAATAGIDPQYAEYSTVAWKRHKVGGDYWTPMLRAQQYELKAVLQDPGYPDKPRYGDSGHGPEPARYLLGVELHDVRRWSEARDAMTPYFERILQARN